MATETETTPRQAPPERATDEDLIARAPAHDGVATQRDLRETERYLQSEIRASEGRLRSDFNAKFDKPYGANIESDDKFDMPMRIAVILLGVIIGIMSVIYALLIAILLNL